MMVGIFDQTDAEIARAFAEQEFTLNAVQRDGTTLLDQLRNVEKITGEVPKELLNLVELPDIFRESWGWFIDLYNARSSGLTAANPISYTEIQAYFQLMQIEPEPWEISVIKQFDSIAREIEFKQAKTENKKKKQ